MNILVIEDDKKIATLIKKSLETDDSGYKVTLSPNGTDGLALANSGAYGLIILDRGLPKMDGIAVLQTLREAGNRVPVLMLTAKTEVEDIVAGLDAGADDYLMKPFEFAELIARVRALIRRSKQDRGAEIRYADVRIDPVNHKVWRANTEIILPEAEYRMLAYLVRNAEKVLYREDIVENCWNSPLGIFSNIVDVYINFLRKKVDVPFSTKLIHTVHRQGYIFEER